MSNQNQNSSPESSQKDPSSYDYDVVSLLGCGYDTNGFYANAKSVRARIYDLPRNTSQDTQTTENITNISYGLFKSLFRPIKRSTTKTAEVYNAYGFMNSLASKAHLSGEYVFFSASIEAKFDNTELVSSNKEMIRMSHLEELGIVDIDSSFHYITMNPTAKTEITQTVEKGGLPATKVLEKYGTHVLRKFVMGGRLDYTSMIDRTKYTGKTDIAVVAGAQYKKLTFGASAKVEINQQADIDKFNSIANTTMLAEGGDSSEVNSNFNKDSYKNWLDSIKESPALIDFIPGSLMPIYDIPEKDFDQARRDELKKAFHEYMEHVLEVWIVPPDSVDVVSSDAGSGAKKNVTFYQPKHQEGWYWLGHSNTNKGLILVKPRILGVVQTPTDYKCAWYDEGSGKELGYSLWNISPMPGYVALGNIARFRKGKCDWNPPSGDEVKGLVCLHQSVCVKGEIGQLIWDDRESGTKKRNGSIWEIKSSDPTSVTPTSVTPTSVTPTSVTPTSVTPTSVTPTSSHIGSSHLGLAANTFYCHNGYSKPEVDVYVMDQEKIKITNPPDGSGKDKNNQSAG
ncbi:hypothetical protein A0J48_000250 [Sphaerospermopsis aphanizomenoides BCCUSP55]|nr:MAC/perforin domain-containing protein [Sphaerospermopsis aphanizomenoides]MBK1985994.1 hypothetical protein [Sphaerospermopsis aphanizomenoides BCCUSP55]